MPLVHVLIPFTTNVACGAAGHDRIAAYRQQVTCKVCKTTAQYKALRPLPRQYQREPGRGKRRRKT